MRAAVACLVVLLAACEGVIHDPGISAKTECDPTIAELPPEPLLWKRVAPFISDLASALELPTDQLCSELGRFPCADVHLVPLGGNDPEDAAQYAPVGAPLATTPAAVDRVVLSACENRATLDAAAGTSARVFTDVPPTDVAVTPASPAVDAQIASLYRRLLRRDAVAEEVALVRELATSASGPRTGRELDVLACFAIGTTTENLMF